LQSFGDETGGQIEQFGKMRALKRQNAKFRQDFLLPNPQPQRFRGQVLVGLAMLGRLGDEFRSFRVKGDNAGHDDAF